MRAAAAAEEFEQATLERNRLQAVRSLLERRRVTGASVGTFDAIAVAVDGRDANAQVFQVRDGVLSDRQSFYLANEAERDLAEVGEEFMLQYYGGYTSIPALLVLQRGLEGGEALAAALVQPPRRSGGDARGRARREAAHPRAGGTQRAAGARPGAPALGAPPPGPGGGARRPAAGARRWTCRRSGSSASTSRTWAGRTRWPRWSCSREARRRSPTTGASRSARVEGSSDDYAAMAEVLGRRFAQWERQSDISPHDPAYDPSFASLPNLVVIDGGKGQLAAGLGPLGGFRDRGVAVVSLAKRVEEIFLPGRRAPLVLAHSTPELQLLQRVRDEAHRFAITHHRARRDKAMTSSLLDDLPGIGPSRKRALLAHFGSPDAVAAATNEDLQAVPGLPAKVGRGYPRLPPSCRLTPACPPGAAQCGDDGRDQAPASAASRRREVRQAGDRVAPGGLRGDHGLLRGGQVDGDERVRGRGLLLRGQSAAGDDPLAGGAVRAQGLEGRAGGGRLGRPRRGVLRGAAGGGGRPRRARPEPSGAVPGGGGADAGDALQGDAPAPPAGAGGQHRGGRGGRAGAAGAAARPREPGDRHDGDVGGDAAREDRRGVPAARDGGAAVGDVHELRLQARAAARGGPGVRRALPGEPPLRAGAARADGPGGRGGRLHRAPTGACGSCT